MKLNMTKSHLCIKYHDAPYDRSQTEIMIYMYSINRNEILAKSIFHSIWWIQMSQVSCLSMQNRFEGICCFVTMVIYPLLCPVSSDIN